MTRIAALLLGFALLVAPVAAEEAYKPTPENLKAREWFQDAKFGMFIHWGVYSVLGDGEWVMNNKKIPVAEYEKLPAQFNPTEFNADEWVAIAKSAGIKYITITSKHHDGFAMFATKQSDWNIVDRTPYKKDPLKMLAEACKKGGIKLFFYHSHLDWNNPNYFPLGRTGHDAGRPEGGDWYKYLDYMDAQLKELLTNYGEIGGIWFDGWWDKPTADWRLDKTYSLIHSLQPACMIGNNHHVAVKPGEDFQMFERDLPGQNVGGHSKNSVVGEIPLETCDTLNGSWGYNKNDKAFKTPRELVHYLVRAAGMNANLLMNVGPMPTGKIQPECVERLKAVGEWMAKNGESIYGTRGGPITPRPWGVTTRKGNTVYVHVLAWQDPVIAIPAVGGKVQSAKLLSGEKVEATEQSDAVIIRLPAQLDPIDTVIAMEIK
jgi:alpha-L-fucosidase